MLIICDGSQRGGACPLERLVKNEPASPPSIQRRLVFPPRRVAAVVLLSALPIASLVGAFEATKHAVVKQGDLTLTVRHPARTLYREAEQLQIDVQSTRPCTRAIVEGLAGYLAHFEDVRVVPTPASAHRLYDGALVAGHRLSLAIHARPADVGTARAEISFDCDGQRGPRIAISTLVFP
jgi:hypothetical protein